jgi:SAM-dependent methyltransferase
MKLTMGILRCLPFIILLSTKSLCGQNFYCPAIYATADEDPQKVDLVAKYERLDSLLFFVKNNFDRDAMPEVQVNALFSCIQKGNVRCVQEYCRMPKVEQALSKNHLEMEHLVAFAWRYIDLIQESNLLYTFYQDLEDLKDGGIAIDNRSTWRKELQYYKLKDGQRILEIGCDQGDLFKVIAREINDADIFLNEIDTIALKNKYYLIAFNEKFHKLCQERNNRISLVAGTTKSTGAEELIFDKIIVRMTFHHFDDHIAMLSSIKKSMRPDTELIIIENFSDDGEHIRCGDLRMTRAELETTVAENGFKMVEQETFTLSGDHNYRLYKFILDTEAVGEAAVSKGDDISF